MGKIAEKVSLLGVIIGVAAVALSAPVSAHVTVKPAEVLTAAYQTFTVSVPNERNVSTVGVKILVPENVQSITPTQKSGWSIAIEKDGEGDAAKTTSITWSGGEINDGTRDDFTFSAKTPDAEAELQWKAYQTYADGVVVSWDQKADAGHGSAAGNKGPFSITNVVTMTAQDVAVADAERAGANAQATVRLAFYSAIAAVALGVIALYFATRKEK
ncbi:MAG: YcnI family protein [Candidatus Microsaccharimonas sp.]